MIKTIVLFIILGTLFSACGKLPASRKDANDKPCMQSWKDGLADSTFVYWRYMDAYDDESMDVEEKHHCAKELCEAAIRLCKKTLKSARRASNASFDPKSISL